MALARLDVSSSLLLVASRRAASALAPASPSTLDARSRPGNRGFDNSSIAFWICSADGPLATGGADGAGAAIATAVRKNERTASRVNRSTEGLREVGVARCASYRDSARRGKAV